MHACFGLCDMGFSDTAASVARTAAEHGIYLSLLAGWVDADTILDRLERRLRDSWPEVIAASAGGDVRVQGVFEAITELLPSVEKRKADEWVTIAKQVCDKLVTGDVVYLHYRLLSGLIHPGFETAVPYLLTRSLGVGQRMKRDPKFMHKDLVKTMAIAGAVWAGYAADALFDGGNFSDTCDAAARRLTLRRLTIFSCG